MSPIALVTWIVIGGLVWGGLIVWLVLAIRKERGKGEGTA